MKKIKIFLVGLSLIACSNFAFAMKDLKQTEQMKTKQEKTKEKIKEEIKEETKEETKEEEEEEEIKIREKRENMYILDQLKESTFKEKLFENEENKNIEEAALEKAKYLFLKKVKTFEFLDKIRAMGVDENYKLFEEEIPDRTLKQIYTFKVNIKKIRNNNVEFGYDLIIEPEVRIFKKINQEKENEEKVKQETKKETKEEKKQKEEVKEEEVKEEEVKEEEINKFLNCCTKDNFLKQAEYMKTDKFEDEDGETEVKKAAKKAADMFLEKLNAQNKKSLKTIIAKLPVNKYLNIFNFPIKNKDFDCFYTFKVNAIKLEIYNSNYESDYKYFLDIKIEKEVNEERKKKELTQEKKQNILKYLNSYNFIKKANLKYKPIERQALEKATNIFVEKINSEEILNKVLNLPSGYVETIFEFPVEDSILDKDYYFSVKVKKIASSSSQNKYELYVNVDELNKDNAITSLKPLDLIRRKFFDELYKNDYNSKNNEEYEEIENEAKVELTSVFLEKLNSKEGLNKIEYMNNGEKIEFINYKALSNELKNKYHFKVFIEKNFNNYSLKIKTKKEPKAILKNSYNKFVEDSAKDLIKQRMLKEEKQNILNQLTRENFYNKAVIYFIGDKPIKNDTIMKAADIFLEKINSNEILNKIANIPINKNATLFEYIIEEENLENKYKKNRYNVLVSAQRKATSNPKNKYKLNVVIQKIPGIYDYNENEEKEVTDEDRKAIKKQLEKPDLIEKKIFESLETKVLSYKTIEDAKRMFLEKIKSEDILKKIVNAPVKKYTNIFNFTLEELEDKDQDLIQQIRNPKKIIKTYDFSVFVNKFINNRSEYEYRLEFSTKVSSRDVKK